MNEACQAVFLFWQPTSPSADLRKADRRRKAWSRAGRCPNAAPAARSNAEQKRLKIPAEDRERIYDHSTYAKPNDLERSHLLHSTGMLRSAVGANRSDLRRQRQHSMKYGESDGS